VDEPDETFTLHGVLDSGTTANTTAEGIGTIIDYTPPFVFPTASLITNSNATDQNLTLIIYENNDGADPTEVLQPTAIVLQGEGQEANVLFDLENFVLNPTKDYTILMKFDEDNGTKVQVDEFILDNDGSGGDITLIGNSNSPTGPLLGADHDVTIGPDGAPGDPPEGMIFILEGNQIDGFTVTEGFTYDTDGSTLELENVHHAHEGFDVDVAELPLGDMNLEHTIDTIDIDNHDSDTLKLSNEDVVDLANNVDNDISIITDNDDNVILDSTDDTTPLEWTADPVDAGVYNWEGSDGLDSTDPSLDLGSLIPDLDESDLG
jgi:hypothetical protein